MDAAKLLEFVGSGLTGGIGGGLIALCGAYWKGKSELLGQIKTQFENLPFLLEFRRLTAFQEEAGKRAATHADIENVLRELHLVTEKTETIKTQIGNDAWTKQRVWEQKRNAYLGILKSCRALSGMLASYLQLRQINFRLAKEINYSPEQEDEQRQDEWALGHKFLNQISDVNEEFEEAFIFLSNGVGLLFDEYTNERPSMLSLVSTSHYTGFEEATQEKIVDKLNFLEQWRGRIVEFAKVDLGVSQTLTLEIKRPAGGA